MNKCTILNADRLVLLLCIGIGDANRFEDVEDDAAKGDTNDCVDDIGDNTCTAVCGSGDETGCGDNGKSGAGLGDVGEINAEESNEFERPDD